jgi:ATP-dependent DNA ligase
MNFTPDRSIIDGEIVCLYAFDLLWLDGEILRSLPLIDRKHRLHELIQKSDCPRIIYAQHIEGQGVGFWGLYVRVGMLSEKTD